MMGFAEKYIYKFYKYKQYDLLKEIVNMFCILMYKIKFQHEK